MLDVLVKSKNYFSCQKLDNENIEQTIIRLLKKNGKLAEKRLFELLPHDLAQTFSQAAEEKKIQIIEETMEFKSFNVFGCPTSTDIDIVCLMPSREDVFKKTISVHALEQLKATLSSRYDIVNRSLDINLVHVDKNGNYVVSSVGGRFIQNIVYYTWSLHHQFFPCIFSGPIEFGVVDTIDHLTATAKFMLDHMKILIGKEDYKTERENRRTIYAGGYTRLKFVAPYIAKIKLPYDTTHKWQNAMKSLTMKLIQSILISSSSCMVYTKPEMVKQIDILFPGTQRIAQQLLTRIKPEADQLHSFLEILSREFAHVIQESSEELIWHEHQQSLYEYPVASLSTATVKLFLDSPLTPSCQFIDALKSIGTTSLNEMFTVKYSDTLSIPESIRDKCLFLDPRSTEWLKFHSTYAAVSTDRKDSSFHEDNFNLVRGSILESLVTSQIDYNVLQWTEENKDAAHFFKNLTVGFLTANGVSCAPDILLVDKNMIIPVEIKCIPTRFIDNQDLRRAVKMAKTQLRTCLNIMNCGTRAIITIVNVYEENSSPKIEVRSAIFHVS